MEYFNQAAPIGVNPSSSNVNFIIFLKFLFFITFIYKNKLFFSYNGENITFF